MISRCRVGESRIDWRSATRASSSSRSSMSSCRSKAASLRSCMSRMARAWISSMLSRPMRPLCAADADSDPRINAMTWSIASIAGTMWIPPLALRQPEPSPPLDDLDLVRDPVADHLVEAQGARHPVDQRQHDHAERVLQLSVLVQVVQHDLGDRVALEHDNEPLPGPAAGLVANGRDPGEPTVLDELGDLGGQVVGVDLEGQLLDDQALPTADLLVLDDGPHDDRATPGPVSPRDSPPPDDQAAGREVRAGNPLDQPVEQFLVRSALRGSVLVFGPRLSGWGLEPLVVLQVPLDARSDLPQVVRRDLGRHPDCD